MASNFFETGEETGEKKVIMKIGKFEQGFSSKSKEIEAEASGSGTPKGLAEAYFTDKSPPILVPSSRSDINEIIVTMNNLFTTVNSMLERIKNLESSILLIENNNNISNSDMKEFIEKSIDKSLGRFFAKNFSESFEVKKSLVEGLEDNDV